MVCCSELQPNFWLMPKFYFPNPMTRFLEYSKVQDFRCYAEVLNRFLA